MRLVNGVLCLLACATIAILPILIQPAASEQCSVSNIIISSITTNGSITHIEWIKDARGHATSTGLMLLSDGTIWRTVDGGLSFVSIQSLVQDERFRSIKQTNDGSKVFLVTNNAWMWTTEDAGATFLNSSSVGFYIHDIKPHPTIADYLLVSAMTPCCQKSLACTSCKALLRTSSDKGVTWKTLAEYLYYRGELAFSWASIGSASNNRSVAFVAYVEKDGDQRVKLGDPMNLYLFSDFENSASLVSEVPNGGPFTVDGSTIMMARVTTGRAGLSNLLVSKDFGATWTTSAFPPISSFDSIREWLPTESGSPFLGVFNGPDYTDGNVFVSDGSNDFSTLSLRGLVKKDHQIHWTHIGTSIPGTYIANVHTDDLKLITETFITYNHGGRWHKLEINDKKRRTTTLQRGDEDRVHLVAPFPGTKFSAPINVPGLILAAGQTGSSITNFDGEALFVSRDAGRNWRQLKSGNFIIFAANGGTLLLAAEPSSLTDTMYFSLDFGATWTQCTFTPHRVKAISMRSNFDDHLSPLVIMDAYDPATNLVTIFTMNVTEVFSRTCASGDFENWELKDEDGNNCVLGVQRTYRRRDQFTLCQKLIGQSSLVSTSPCACTKEDFICPYCYERKDNQGDCDFMWDYCGEDKLVRPQVLDNCTDPQTTSWEDLSRPGIVKSPASTCSGGRTIQDFDAKLSCPPRTVIDNPPPPVSTLHGEALVTFGAIAIALCGIVIVGGYFFVKHTFGGAPAIDFAAWKTAHSPATENDLRREHIKSDLEYQSDVEMNPTGLAVDESNSMDVVPQDDDEKYSTLDV